MLDKGTYAPSKMEGTLSTKRDQIKEAVKKFSWQAIYAKSDTEFEGLVQMMIRQCKGYGYDECVAWCEAHGKSVVRLKRTPNICSSDIKKELSRS